MAHDPLHPSLAELEASLASIRRSPADDGRLERIVRRPRTGERERLDAAELDLREGLVGDNWRARGSRRTDDGSSHPDMQLNLMNSRAAQAVAGDRERWDLAGDQLYVDLDLRPENLPPGTRLRIGDATIEVTPLPHTGCRKFVDRFGLEAMKFVNSPAGRALNLRGICARVVEAGSIRVGDRIRKA